MANTEEYIGKKFGRLTIVEFSHKKQRYSSCGKKNGHDFYYKCKCDCGNETISRIADLKNGKASSCGCYRVERTKEINKKYETAEFWNTKLYKIYAGIKSRCLNIRNKRYIDYGARGITICDEWKNDYSLFYNWAISKGYKDGLSIDRINNDGNYEPSNCRFVTSKIQNNNKRNNRYITYNGKTQTMKQWADELNINYRTLKSRLNILGWSVENALNTPIAKDYTYLLPSDTVLDVVLEKEQPTEPAEVETSVVEDSSESV